MRSAVCHVCGKEALASRLTLTVFGEETQPQQYHWYVCQDCRPGFTARSPQVFVED